jgi:hypothetical protein
MRKDESLRLRRLVNELFFKKDSPNEQSVPSMAYRVTLFLHGQSQVINI